MQGNSRTEAHGHKRKGAASMEVKPAGKIGLRTHEDFSKRASNDPKTESIVFDRHDLAQTLKLGRKNGRVRSSLHLPTLPLSDLQAEGVNVRRVLRSIDQLDEQLLSSQKGTVINNDMDDQMENGESEESNLMT